VGKLYGPARASLGGIGSVSLRVGRLHGGALVAVNAVGDVLDETGQVLAGAQREDGSGFMDTTRALLRGEAPPRLLPGTATTIGVVATDAALTKAQANQLGDLAHRGLSRAIDHWPRTGDTLLAPGHRHRRRRERAQRARRRGRRGGVARCRRPCA
jgi:L-aminopeptidase/D-esterase-like protein